MKKKLLVTSLALLGGLGVCFTVSAADGPLAKRLVNSRHNFSGSGGVVGGNTALYTDLSLNGQTCLPCHAPHNNLSHATELLWNHQSNLAPSYTMYSSPSFNGDDVGGALVISPTSKFCLSCHDGTIATDSYGLHTGDGSKKITGGANLGSDFGNDHPYSFLYNNATVAADTLAGGSPGLYAPSVVIAAGLPLFGSTGSEMMECGTCHDVHNKHGWPKLLNADNTNSALCLTCHIK
jgi:predicted CXXCH cytochrome family protein